MNRFDWLFILFIAGAIGLMVYVVVDSQHRVDRKCAELMTYAHSTRDTLDAKIACAAISDASSSRLTTAVAAGAVAGAIAGSSR